MKDLISVIVPIYNVENYLEKCIRSIQKQTYENLEIILVDDGSPDQCGKLCDEEAKKDARIQVIHKINGGLSDARNAGLDIATGNYILFIDSDDFIHPQMVQYLHELAEEQQAEIAVCDFQYVEEGSEEPFELLDPQAKKKCQMMNGREMQFCYFNDKENRVMYTVAWNKLYRRELFEEIRYPKGKVHEDEFTTFKICYQADRIAISKEKLYAYLVRKQSIMGQFNKRRFDLLEAYREKMRFYVDKKEYELYRRTMQIYMRMTAQYIQWITTDDTGCKQIAMNQRKEFTKLYKKTGKSMCLPFVTRAEGALFTHWFGGYLLLWKFARR